MVTGFVGADIDRLRLLAVHFQQGADELTQLAQRLSHQVTDDPAWAGSDGDERTGRGVVVSSLGVVSIEVVSEVKLPIASRPPLKFLFEPVS